MKQAAVVALLSACAVVGFVSFRLLAGGDPPPAGPGWNLAALPDRMPAFTLAAVEGGDVAIEQYLDKPLVLNFWATWCQPCREEMPLLEALYREAGADLHVVGVAVDHDLTKVREFLAGLGISYPNLGAEIGPAYDVATSFGIFEGFPMTIYAAPGGEILTAHRGELFAEDIVEIRATLTGLARGAIGVDEARRRLQAKD